MHTIFTYGGNRKSALTPHTILFGNSPAKGDRFRFGAYSSASSYDSVATVGPLPLSPEGAAALADVQALSTVEALTGRISAIDAAIANLTLFESQTRAYYDTRVSRTSGGKRSRLRTERADLCNQALAEIALLKSARASAVRRSTAVAVSSQSDYNPNTGVALTPVEKETAIAQATANPPSSLQALIIPVGAAVAALFFLKGH